MSLRRLLLLLPLLAVTLSLANLHSATGASDLAAMRQIGIVDAHAHVFTDSPVVLDLLERFNLRFVNITVVDPYDKGYEGVEPQQTLARGVARAAKGRAPWVATFDAAGFEQPGFAKRVIAELETSFRNGAVGVKIYKTIGMLIRSKDGRYVMPDDPAFAPILDAIAANGKTLYAHIAEPAGSWKAYDPADPDSGYYRDNPLWQMYGKPDRPAKATILAARDRMIAQHPKLRIVGCHLGSNEEDVDEIAKRLDQFPNFAVDTAARVTHLALQPHDKVRAFMIKYQDRILYATDDGAQAGENVQARVNAWQADLERHYKYFATNEKVKFMGKDVQGLGLPEPVVRKIFRTNAEKWVPGIVAK